MKPSAPWSIKGIEPGAREAAKRAAAQAGMTLGDWFNQILLDMDPASLSAGRAAAPADAPVRSRLSAQAAPPEAIPATAAIPATTHEPGPDVTGALGTLAANLESAEQSRVADMVEIRSRLEGITARVTQLEEHPAGVSEDVESALRDIASHVADTRQKTEQALAATESALEDMAGRIEHSIQRSNDAVTTVGRAIELMAQRLDKLEGDVQRGASRALEAAQRQPATSELRAPAATAALPGTLPEPETTEAETAPDGTPPAVEDLGADADPVVETAPEDDWRSLDAGWDPEPAPWQPPAADDDGDFVEIAPVTAPSARAALTERVMERMEAPRTETGAGAIRAAEDSAGGDDDVPPELTRQALSRQKPVVEAFIGRFGDDDDARDLGTLRRPPAASGTQAGRARRPEDVIAAIRRAARGEAIAAYSPDAARSKAEPGFDDAPSPGREPLTQSESFEPDTWPAIPGTEPSGGAAEIEMSAGSETVAGVRGRRNRPNRSVMYLLIAVSAAVFAGSVAFWASRQGYF